MKKDGAGLSRLIIKRAREVLKIESQAVGDQAGHIDQAFVKVVHALEETTERGGQVIVMGIGKSGLVGRKIAATLSSTGTPALFFHPSEGLHGDVGVVRPLDAVLVLSASGETEEIKKILPILKERSHLLIAMTSRKNSRLGRSSDFVICSAVRKEACPMNLIPTASTTAMLSLGDALAVVLMEKKGFKASDFAKLHPGGTLGKKLSMKVGDLMHKGSRNSVVRIESTVRGAILEMTRTRLGAANVVDRHGTLVGFFTDGDLRRRLQKDGEILNRSIQDVMTKNPCTITPDQCINDALMVLKSRRFDNMPVVDRQGKSVGILDEQDLLAEGIA